MNKSEALTVLHEIYGVCRESLTISCVSLDSKSSQIVPDGRAFQIRLKCELDNQSRRCIKPILQKHRLAMKEEEGFVTIS